MDSKKSIGMDVHEERISIAVTHGAGKIVMECVIETEASMILQLRHSFFGRQLNPLVSSCLTCTDRCS
jgi:hypothetical protein